ncbi:energy transducer TonB [Pseudomonas syringae]|uniref:energy transducer TonB n=1 Tax=Pseudomonas syringae TaxID=317 RepID=UPI0010139066|nr:energy transducer TonB [Pseudomonas syringae]
MNDAVIMKAVPSPSPDDTSTAWQGIPFSANTSRPGGLNKPQVMVLIAASVLIHGAIWWYMQTAQPDVPEVAPQVPEMTIELTSPTPPAPTPAAAPSPPAPPTPAPAPPAPAAPPAPVKESAAVSGLASLGNPPPEYPGLALRRSWEGRVILRIKVLPNGRAGAVEVTKSSGKPVLDEAAVEAVRNWKFIPAKRGDTPIEGFATQTIDFKLPE